MKAQAVTAVCYAKLNLGLRVLSVRPDGFHEVRTVLQTIDLHDTLVVAPSDRVTLEIVPQWEERIGSEIPQDDRNLVLRAAASLSEPLAGRGAAFRLVKRIPTAAGLGGASADAAATLLALERLYRLGLSAAEMHEAAASLGSDVPFFLYGGACLALGRGEEVYPLPDPPRALHFAVAFPAEGLSTSDVYGAWDGLLTSHDKMCKVNDFAPWSLVLRGERPGMANDLEEAAIRLRPGLRALRSTLEASGALAAAMTGSGSAFFGLYPGAKAAAEGARRVRQGGYAAVAARSVNRERRDRTLWSEPDSASRRGGSRER